MTLSETARERLADVRDLEPTSNSELRDRWGMDSGKAVAAYLNNELSEHTYRDDNSRIRAVDGSERESPRGGSPNSPESISDPGTDVESHVSEDETSGTGNTSSGGPETPRDDVQQSDEWSMTDTEFDRAIRSAREAGYEEGFQEGQAAALENMDLEAVYQDGYEEGYSDGYRQDEQEHGDSTHEQSHPDDPRCQECGGELYDFTGFDSGQWHRINGQTVNVSGDYQCSNCGTWWTDKTATA